MDFTKKYDIITKKISILSINNLREWREIMKKKKKMALSTQIFIALVLAIIAGIALTGAPQFATG